MTTTPPKVPTRPPTDLSPRFCSACGAPLVITERQYGYWQTTGEPKFYRYYRCPNARWWNNFFGKIHDR